MYYKCMTMQVAQVRLPKAIVKQIGQLVDQGLYTNKSDVLRDAVRRLVLDKQIGSIPNTGDSVKEIRAIRKKLSKEKFDLDEINKLAE